MTASIIYTLADPRFTGAAAIRYISVTGDLYTRFALHLSSTGSNPEKDARIKQLKAAHIMVCVLTLEIIVDDPHEARLREGYWILHYLHLALSCSISACPRTCHGKHLRMIRKSGSTSSSEKAAQLHKSSGRSGPTAHDEGIQGEAARVPEDAKSHGRVSCVGASNIEMRAVLHVSSFS